jgi:probable F420-dependent oxidoreductase
MSNHAISTPSPTYGVLLPHFGRYVTAERMRNAGPMIESLGFDSVFVRDHVIQIPHEHEDPDVTFIDAFVVLSTVAATTTDLKLGTAVLVPHRHPILAAMMLSSLDFISGGGRVIAGWGIGNWDAEFEAVGLGAPDRRELIEEYVAILRRLWTGEPTSHESETYRFSDVQQRPVPAPGRPIPIWYGGNSAAAVRRTVEYCDGWAASRIPLANFKKRMARMRRIADEHQKPTPDAAVIPYVVPADTVEQGVARLHLDGLAADLNANEPPPASGRYETMADVDGAAIAGPPDVIVEAIRRFQTEGAQHIIFDLRPCLEDWEDRLQDLGENVLPLLRRGDGAPARDREVAAAARGDRETAPRR